MILADKITEERKKNGWSQEELANQLGVSRQAVSKWESAGAVPDLQRILQMSELFGVSTDYLLKDEMQAENITYHESTESYAEPLKKVTMENANEFLDMKRNGSKVVANAASMCILSPILLIVLVTMAEDSVFHVSESLATVFGCVFLLGMVAAAVFLFITYGMRESHMEHFEKECFETEYGVSGMVREKKDSYEPIFIRGTAAGVVLCILAVIPAIIAGSMEASDYYCGLSVGLLLFILAIGVNLLVRVGMVKSSYDTLLQEGEYTKEEKLFKKNKDFIEGALAKMEAEPVQSESYYRTLKEIYELDSQLQIAMTRHGQLLSACTQMQQMTEEAVKRAKLGRLRSHIHFGALLTDLIRSDNAGLLEQLLSPVLLPHIKKRFTLDSLDEALTVKPKQAEAAEKVEEEPPQEIQFADEMEDQRIRKNYTFLMNNLLAAFEKRDTFTLSEFGAAMSRMYSPDILKNADYYSFFVNLCQKQEYVIGGQTENESFLDDILSGAFADREPVHFTITPKSAGAQDEQPMEQSELVFERKGTK